MRRRSHRSVSSGDIDVSQCHGSDWALRPGGNDTSPTASCLLCGQRVPVYWSLVEGSPVRVLQPHRRLMDRGAIAGPQRLPN
jgi:hypothetical protein